MKKRVKRWLGILVTGALVLLSTTSSFAAQKKLNVALAVGTSANPFYISMATGAKDAADQLGVEFTWQGPKTWDFAKQSMIVKALVTRGVDFILIAPCDPNALIEPLQSAVDEGIAVATVDTDLSSNLPLFNIASENYEGGRIAGETLAKLINYQGEVALMGAMTGVTTNEERYAGFKDAIKKYTEIKLVTTQYSGSSQTKATSQMEAVLIGHPDLAGAFGVDTPTAHGVAIGIRNAGKKGQVKLVGFDSQPLEVQDLKEGLTQALIAQAPYAMGFVGVQLAYDYLQGYISEFPRHLKTGFYVITPENVNEPEAKKWIYTTELPR